jgi:pyridoxal phosphate enzyme (YggS family)
MGPQNSTESMQRVCDRIKRAATAAGRTVDSVTLLAVGKSHAAPTLRAAAQAGVRHFGESYVQEALPKIAELRDLNLTWHFIGQIQGNKTRPIAEHFAWVHGVDRLRVAARLSDQRPYHAPPLNVCVQVNVGAESAKGGASPADVPALISAMTELPRLKVRGLMCLPPPEPTEAGQRHWFAQLRRLLESLNASGTHLDTLSMGMSADFEAAILEGATIVRIGTALFGPRP